MAGKKSRPGRRNSNQVLGYVVWNACFYAVVAVPLVLAWLTLNGFLPATWAWVIGIVLTVSVGWILTAIVRSLASGPVNRSGCGVALMCYWASPLLLALLYWQGGFDVLVIGTLIVPFIIVMIGIMVSRINPTRPGDPWPKK
ncbi:MAG: hypothetical protein WCI67_00095 [Chloroflexales bacterium]